MAIIRGAFGGGQIKGSIAGNTFQQSPYGTVIRNRTVPVNPNTTPQVSVRTAFDYLSNRWTNVLGASLRAGWEAYAALTPLPDRFGVPVATRGRQMYMRCNVARKYQNLTVIDTAPSTPGLAPNPSMTITYDTTDGIVITALSAPTLVSGDLVLIRLGLPVNESRDFYKAPFVAKTFWQFSQTPPLEIVPNTNLIVGQKYFVASRSYLANGKVSFETIQSGVVV